jgi:hypothetical protein
MRKPGDTATRSVGRSNVCESSGHCSRQTPLRRERQSGGATKQPSAGRMARSSTGAQHRRTDPRILHMQIRQITVGANPRECLTDIRLARVRKDLLRGAD